MDLLARTLTAALLAVILIALAATSADATQTRDKCNGDVQHSITLR